MTTEAMEQRTRTTCCYHCADHCWLLADKRRERRSVLLPDVSQNLALSGMSYELILFRPLVVLQWKRKNIITHTRRAKGEEDQKAEEGPGGQGFYIFIACGTGNAPRRWFFIQHIILHGGRFNHNNKGYWGDAGRAALNKYLCSGPEELKDISKREDHYQMVK